MSVVRARSLQRNNNKFNTKRPWLSSNGHINAWQWVSLVTLANLQARHHTQLCFIQESTQSTPNTARTGVVALFFFPEKCGFNGGMMLFALVGSPHGGPF
jgi:hypothetical protein